MTAFVAFPIAFAIVYPTICISTVVVAVRTSSGGRKKSIKYPLVCAAGAHQPAYKIYSIGCVVSALLLVASSISHTLHMLELKPDANKGFFWILAGVGCLAAIGIAAMGIIPMRDPFKAQHNIAGYIGIGCGCWYAGMLIGAAGDVSDQLSYPIATIIMRLIAAIILGCSCCISLTHLLQAERLAKKRKKKKQKNIKKKKNKKHKQQNSLEEDDYKDGEESSKVVRLPKQQQQQPSSEEESPSLPENVEETDLETNTNNNGKEEEGDDSTTNSSATDDDESIRRLIKKEQKAWLIAAWGQYIALFGVTIAVASLALAMV